MPKVAASLVFPVSSPPLRNGIVVLDDAGIIKSVSSSGPSFRESAGVEFYSGIIVPGFTDILCGDRENSWLAGRGARIAGRIIPGCAEITGSWRGLYGEAVDYRIYSDNGHFHRTFEKGKVEGIYFATADGTPVLATGGHSEMLELFKKLQDHYSFREITGMAALNGALALGFGHIAGSLEPGRQPGIYLIEGADMGNMKLLPGSTIRRLY